MNADELRFSKSFYGELTLASNNAKINFSEVFISTGYLSHDLGRGSETSTGYDLKFIDYMTANTFEHYSEKFYFRYSDSDDSYSMIMSDKGQVWVGVTNNGYLWKTRDSARCCHFKLINENNKQLSLADITDETVKVYLGLPPPQGGVVTTYSETKVGAHSWSYLTSSGGQKALFNLKIIQRGVKGFWE